MKQADIIRLGIIAVALFLAYNGILHVIEFIDFLIALIIDSNSYKGELDALSIGLKTIGFFLGAFLLIKNSRRISIFIDEQK